MPVALTLICIGIASLVGVHYAIHNGYTTLNDLWIGWISGLAWIILLAGLLMIAAGAFSH
ncbi:MAG: hypothetical protein ACYDA1_10800 [Vulcanimicrobiaceae bacterium]